MAHPVATTNMVGPARLESRQARLDAAIALFRSEASASGYVVEEVRLRLPVPDVDVMPRVIIAQQSGSSGTPPTFPRPPKHHRTMNSYANPVQSEHPSVSGHDNPYASQDTRYHAPVSGSQTEHKPPTRPSNLPTSTGFKRTVSGSVIHHPVPVRIPSVQRENGHGHLHSPNVSQQLVSTPKSIPYATTKENRPIHPPHDGQRGSSQLPQYWNTMMNGDKGQAILRAAESMHRMRHGHLESRFTRPNSKGNKPIGMDVNESSQLEAVKNPSPKVDSNSSSTPTTNPIPSRNGSPPANPEGNMNGRTRDNPVPMVNPKEKNVEKEENTHHRNGHEIPESHVQLLLSSAADISARERMAAANKQKRVEEKPMKEENKSLPRPQAVVNGKPSGTKVAPVSSGKSFSSRSRKDGSDRQGGRLNTLRPFKCTKCPSSFDRDGHLRVHILAVHEKKRPFVCQVCDASFGHSSSLLRHVRTVHQASPAVGSGRTSDGSRNPSISNDSGTTRSEDLYDDDNEGARHFRCSVCRQTFNRVALLNRHVANRHPLQSFSPSKSELQRDCL